MIGVITWIVLYIIYFYSIQLVTRLIFRQSINNGLCSINYQGESIVQSFGLNIWIHYFILLVFIHFFIVELYPAYMISFHDYVFFLFIFSLSLLGWFDDQYGTASIKGLRGHLAAFVKERIITSGFIKAIIGTVLSATVSLFYSAHLLEWLLHVLVLIFSIHLLNLLDVRPGRAIKGIWCLLICVLPFMQAQPIVKYILPLYMSTYVLFQYDRKRLAMLGDTGSNVLGGIGGYVVITQTSPAFQVLVLIVFMSLSLLAERYSFTEYIKRTPWLSKLDKWGTT